MKHLELIIQSLPILLFIIIILVVSLSKAKSQFYQSMQLILGNSIFVISLISAYIYSDLRVINIIIVSFMIIHMIAEFLSERIMNRNLWYRYKKVFNVCCMILDYTPVVLVGTLIYKVILIIIEVI